MSYGTLNHGDTRQRNINAGGFERIQPEIYCEVHGWFPIWLFGDADGFKKRHAHCDRKPKNGAELKEALAAAV